ncbi:MAG: hypothetical protein CM15mP60_1420 [Alphaproteobacteria bacterium]|nr:MAG: hypothetical protein CM15mP60_1420 [Alphaproteobacteria bacterium]
MKGSGWRGNFSVDPGPETKISNPNSQMAVPRNVPSCPAAIAICFFCSHSRFYRRCNWEHRHLQPADLGEKKAMSLVLLRRFWAPFCQNKTRDCSFIPIESHSHNISTDRVSCSRGEKGNSPGNLVGPACHQTLRPKDARRLFFLISQKPAKISIDERVSDPELDRIRENGSLHRMKPVTCLPLPADPRFTIPPWEGCIAGLQSLRGS